MSYAVRIQTGRLLPITASFACGSVVRVYLFPEHVAQTPGLKPTT
jgi:hypothetical protein